MTVDKLKELAIVDDTVVGDPRGNNAADGPWSFRYLVEQMAPSGTSASDFTLAWLSTYLQPNIVNLFTAPARPLANSRLICPWLQKTASNGCDSTCTTCTARTLDLSLAPFRLMAITNRLDLATKHPEDPNNVGEARFLFAGMNGPGDDPNSSPLFMSVIFEFHQLGTSRAAVAASWHKLGSFADTGDAFKQAVAGIMGPIAARNAVPSAPLGSAIAQIRINEREFDWNWSMREFHAAPTGLVLASLDNTPDASLNGTQQLAQFLNSNKDAVTQGLHVLPPSMSGPVATLQTQWNAPGVTTDLVDAFTVETCNGCHQRTGAALDFNFQVSPLRTGLNRLSTFLYDPTDLTHDELARRQAFLCTALSGS